MIRTRRILLFAVIGALLILSVAFGAASVNGSAAYAESDEAKPRYGISEDGVEGLSGIGYDLNGYQASIAYHSYTLNISGVYYGFVVTLDRNFLMSTGRVDNGVFYPSDMFDYLKTLFSYNGYTVSVDEFNGQMTAYLKFSGTTDYYVAVGRDGYMTYEKNTAENKGFLFNEYRSDIKTEFSRIEEEGNLLNLVLSACYGVGAERDKILLTYTYGTPYKVIDTDADSVNYSYDKRIYLHTFNMTMDTADRTISITQRNPNSVGWYALAVIIALPFIVAPAVFAAVKRRKKGRE